MPKKQQQQQQQTAICDKVFKNGPSKVWKTVFKNFEGVWSAWSSPYSFNFFKGCQSSTNFTWFVLEYFVHMNPFQLSIAFGIETIHLIYSANQMSDFCRKCNTRQKWVNGMLTSYLRFDFWLLLIQSLMCSYHQFLRPFLKVFWGRSVW